MSQEYVALELGVARNTVVRYEKDTPRRRSAALLQRLASLYGAPSVDALLAGPDTDLRPYPVLSDLRNQPPRVSEAALVQGTYTSVQIVKEVIMVPTFNGYPVGDFSTDAPEYAGTIPLPKAKTRGDDIVVVYLPDDAMYPNFPAGTGVAFDLSITRPYQGEHVLLEIAGRKLFRTWTRHDDGQLLAVPINQTFGRGDPFDPACDRVLGAWIYKLEGNPRRVRR